MKESAYKPAVRVAVKKLSDVDLPARCRIPRLPQPGEGRLPFRAFGMDMKLLLSDHQLFQVDSETPVKVSDRVLVLHYLLCDLPVKFSDRMISFRELTGGQFYWELFCAISVHLLVKRFGSHIEQLKESQDRLDWEPVSISDLGARIHVIGNLYVTLIYRLGDEEFPPAADLLFDAAVKRVYNA